MADSDKEETRLRKREDPSCTDSFSVSTSKLPEGRKAKDCDTTTTPEAAPFVRPNPCPPAPTTNTVIPEPLEIPNAEQVATCGDDTYPQTTPPKPTSPTEGYNFTVDAGDIVELFNFTSIPDITSDQLVYISGISSVDRDELANVSTTQARVSELTGLSSTQAAYLKSSVSDLHDSADQKALDLALDSINCFYENVEQIVNCTAGAITDGDNGTTDQSSSVPADYDGLYDNPSVVAAAQFTSNNSQAEADNLANDLASNLLKCLFCNAEVTRTCEDVGYGSAVPVSGDQVGSVTVSAFSVCSTSSQEDADRIARELAESQLNCFYLNTEITRTCSDVGLATGDPGVDGPVAGDYAAGTKGYTITVPAGSIVSFISVSDANSTATLIAESMLDCWVGNDAQTVDCEDETITPYGGGVGTLDIPPSSDSESGEVAANEIKLTQAGTLIDAKTDADALAAAIAATRRSCIYCNPTVSAKCAPSGMYTSIDETETITVDTYCCPGEGGGQMCYDLAINTAIPILTANKGDNCRYCNSAQTATCDEPDGDNCIALEPSSLTIEAGIFCIGLYPGVDDVPYTPEQAQTAADDIALLLADSALVCLYTHSTVINDGEPDEIPAETFIAPNCAGVDYFVDTPPGPGADGADGDPGGSGTCSGSCYGIYS